MTELAECAVLLAISKLNVPGAHQRGGGNSGYREEKDSKGADGGR